MKRYDGLRSPRDDRERNALASLRVELQAHAQVEQLGLSALSDADLLRALRARELKVQSAAALVVQERSFRDKHLPIPEDHPGVLAVRARNPALVLDKADNEGRPVVVGLTARHNRFELSLGEVEAFGLWLIEHTVAHAQRIGHEKFTLLFDLADFGWAQMDLPVARKMNELLVQVYPERLGKCLLVNAPYVFLSFYKLVKPFIDEATREKIVFVRDMNHLYEFVPREDLPARYGGPRNFDEDVKSFAQRLFYVT
mmetsp:Transcript_8403/g.22122  ORF Transcript_8403/g.22122 Transcript_8403/m.22122 type:complete len:255 (+) Transcript_8403:73-837(+)